MSALARMVSRMVRVTGCVLALASHLALGARDLTVANRLAWAACLLAVAWAVAPVIVRTLADVHEEFGGEG